MKIFKKKNSSMGFDVAVLSASRMLAYAISLIGTMQLSRFRTLAEYGTYSQMVLTINLFTSLLTLGLPSCLNYFLARAETKEEKNKFLSIYYITNSALGILVGAFLLLATPLIEKYFQNNEIGRFWLFLAIFPCSKIINQSVENLLITHKKTNWLVTYRIFHSLSIVFLITFVEFMGWTFSTYVHMYLCSEVCFMLIVYFMAMKLDGIFTLKPDFDLLKKIFVFAIPLGLSTAAGTLKAEMDKFVIGYFYTTEEFAIYSNAAKELPLTFIASSITAVLLPVIAKMLKNDEDSDAVKLWNETTIISYIINSYFAFALFVFSKEAMTVLYSEKYASGALVFGIYSMTLLFRSTYFGMILQSKGKTKYILQSSLGSLAINFILNIVFCKIIGFAGPAFATIISMMWNAGFQLYKTSKIINMPIKNIFPWKKLFFISIVNILLGIVFAILKYIVPLELLINSEIEAIFMAICWLFVYALIMKNTFKEKIKILRKY